MKCFNCNEEMIYRDDIRGLEHADMPYGTNTNSLIVKKTEIMEGLFSKKEVVMLIQITIYVLIVD